MRLVDGVEGAEDSVLGQDESDGHRERIGATLGYLQEAGGAVAHAQTDWVSKGIRNFNKYDSVSTMYSTVPHKIPFIVLF